MCWANFNNYFKAITSLIHLNQTELLLKNMQKMLKKLTLFTLNSAKNVFQQGKNGLKLQLNFWKYCSAT